MSQTKTYISNEMERIEDDFNKSIYFILGLAKVTKGLVAIVIKIVQGTKRKDLQALNYFIKLKNSLETTCLIIENINRHYKAENKEAKEHYEDMFANICRVIGITISTLTFDRFDQFASLMIDFNQGNYAVVEEHLIDSILDYEGSETLEGFGIIQQYCPHLSVDEKEQMAKDLVKWADLRNLK